MGNICPELFGFKKPSSIDSDPLLEIAPVAPAAPAADAPPIKPAQELSAPMRRGLRSRAPTTLYGKFVQDVVPDLSGKVAIVTGANSGTGFWCARALAAKGATVVLACRDLSKAKAAKAEMERELRDEASVEPRLEILHLDLASFASVRAFAADMRARYSAIDILVNNAGVMAVDKSLTEDGWDVQLQVNHLSHFLLTCQLFGLLARAAHGARIVSHSSAAAWTGSPRINAANLNDGAMDGLCGLAGRLPGAQPFVRYGQSKLANVLFSFELHRRLRAARLDGRIKAVCAHPGFASTGLFDAPGKAGHLPPAWGCFCSGLMQTAADGALPLLLASTYDAVESGAFYGPERGMRGQPVRCKAAGHANDLGMARELWVLSELACGCRFAFAEAAEASLAPAADGPAGGVQA
jgi:NAD(P)-dependent dehydrogenase (short-subunit alcohol dehydrogenase family)